MSNTVVVLGAGIGGLATATQLRELLPEDDRIVLVDRSFEHVQGLSLLWMLRGWRDLDRVRVTPSQVSLAGVRQVAGTVDELDVANRRVYTTTGPLAYDALVIALGAQLNTAIVPGLEDTLAAGVAAHYYTPDAALDTHRKLRQIRSGRVVFLVANTPYKCPAAPYEGAMLAADLLTEIGVRADVTINVYTPEPQPMPVAGPTIGQGVTAMLRTAGIGFHPGRQVDHVDTTAQQIVFTDGEQVPFDLLVFIPPHQPPGPITAAGFSPAGWAPVDPHSLTTRVEGVWAMGDVASITLPSGKPLPKAAVFARGQAPAVATGIARHLGHDAPWLRFTGNGHCYLETGGGLAARGAGDFYHPDGPQISLSEPSAELHQAKEQEETNWITQWGRHQARR